MNSIQFNWQLNKVSSALPVEANENIKKFGSFELPDFFSSKRNKDWCAGNAFDLSKNLHGWKNLRRVLIIKPSSLGDIIHAFPAVSLIKKYFPGVQVDWVVMPQFAEVLKYLPGGVDNAIIIRRRQMGKVMTFLPEFFKFMCRIRREKYDLIIDLQGLLRSGIFGAAAHGVLAGFANPREQSAAFFYKQTFEVNEQSHALERNLELVRGIFKLDRNKADSYCQLPIYPEVVSSLKATAAQINLDLTQNFIAVIPGARWLSKRFPAKLFAEIVVELGEKHSNLNFVIAGSPDEMPEAESICDLLPASLRPRTYILTGKTSIPELFELLRFSLAVLCNDSGPMHIAAALDKPVAALFGPTIPERTGPYGRHCRFFQCDIKCLKCMRRECPLPETNCHNLKSTEISLYIDKFIGCN